MTRLKFLFVLYIEFLVILCYITSVAFGINSTDNKSVQSGDSLNSEVSNIHYGYYNYFFGANSYGNTVIAKYGKLPVLETEAQKEHWNSNLEELSNKIKNTVASEYMYPHGELMTCGTNDKGYFAILFKYGNINESLMNEIYTLIDKSAKEIGMQDVPVEFSYGIYREQIPLNQEGGRDHWLGESTENLSETDIHVIEEYMKKKPEHLGDGNIANYGKIPLIKDENELSEWGQKLMLIHEHIRGKMAPYMGKDVITYGYGITRFNVGISENLPYEKKTALAKEIYQIIDEEARKENVTDVPVVFHDSKEFKNDLIKAGDAEAVEEITNLSISQEEKDGKLNNSSSNNSDSDSSSANYNKSSKNNPAPCFGLLGGLFCLYGGWKLRKK